MTVHRRAPDGLVVLLLVASLSIGVRSTCGADPDVATRLREVELPLGSAELNRWIDAGWQPIEAARYRRFRDSDVRKSSRTPGVRRAVYRARFEDGSLVAGEMEAELRVPPETPVPRLVHLAPLTLPLGNVRTKDGPLVCGLGDEGATVVYTNARETTMLADWSLRGRRSLRSHEFDIGVPRAAVTTLRIHLPADHVLRSDFGIVRRLDSVDGPGDAEWLVDLGTRTRCQLRVSPVEQGKSPNRPMVLAERRVEFSVQPDSIGFRTTIELDPVRSTVDRFLVRVPATAGIDRVELGAGTPLAWRRTTRDDATTIEIRLPDPLTGPSRPIVVRGRIPLELDETWTLPRFAVTGVPSNGVKPIVLTERGTYELNVAAPLRFDVVDLAGMRRVAPESEVAEGTVVAFEEASATPTAEVRVSYPDLVARAAAVTLVDTRTAEWTLRSAIHWTARTGRTFRLRVRVPRGWRITNVRSGTGSESDVTGWRLRRDLGGVQVVTVDLLASLNPQNSRTIVVEATIDTNRVGRREVRPVVQPFDCDVVDSVLLLDGPADWTPDLLDAARFEPREIGDLSEDHVGLLDEFDLEDLERLHSFRTRKPRASALLGTGAGPSFVRATTRVDVDDVGQPIVMREFEFSDARRPPLVVFQTGPPPGEWTLAGPIDEEDTEGRRVTWSPVPSPNASGTGTGWRPELGSAAAGAVRLRSTAIPLDLLNGGIELPTIPGEPTFEGTLVFARGASEKLQPSVAGVTPTEVDGELTWSYTTSVAVSLAHTSSTVEASIVSAVDLSLTTLLDRDSVRHELTMSTVPDGSARRVEFELPGGCEFAECLVDGRPVRISSDGGSSVRLPTAHESHRVVLRYAETRRPSFLRTTISAPWPSTSSTIRDRRWRIAMPPDWSPASGFVVDRSPIPWTRRLFGPIGRRGGFGLFNPLLATSWAPSEPRLANPTASDAGVPEGWLVEPVDVAADGTAVATVVHTARNESIGWVVLCGCSFASVLVRLLQRGSASAWTPAWCWTLLAFFVTTWLLPADLAVVVGGAFSGVIIGLCLPLQFLERRGLRASSSAVSDGSTMSFRYGPQMLLLAGVLQSLVANAQEPVTLPIRGGEFDVVIPTTADDTPARVVYVSEPVRDLLDAFETKRPERELFVVETAEYRADLSARGGPTVEARYRVALLEPGRPVVVELPIRGGNLSGRTPCLVNGREVAVEPGTRPDTVRIEVAPAPTDDSLEIVCTLHPPVESRGDRSAMRLVIPPIAQSRLVVSGSMPGHEYEVTGMNNGAASAIGAPRGDGETSVVALGPLQAFVVDWGPASDGVVRTESVSFDTTTLYEPLPTITRLRCRVKMRLGPTVAGTFEWDIPSRFGIEDVSVPEGAEYETTASPAGGGMRVLVRSPVPAGTEGDQPWVVDFALVTSAAPGEQANVLLPDTSFLRPVDETGTIDFVETTTRIGVLAGTEWQSLSLEDMPDGVRMLAPEALDEVVRKWNTPRPRLAFELDGVTPPALSLAPRHPQRIGRQRTRHLVGQSESNWTYEAEIVVAEAPVFGHRLHVPDNLVVETVSVIANDVERVARWDREANAIDVELTDRLVGPQRVRLSGWMPVDLDADFELSRPGLEEAVIEESELVVAATPAIGLEVAANGPVLDRLAGPLDRPVPTSWRLLGRFVVEPGEPQLSVRARPPSKTVRTTTYNRLRPNGNGTWALESRLRIESLVGTVEGCRVELPSGYILREVVPDGGTATPADRVLSVDFEPPVGESRPREIALSGDVVAPTGTVWNLRTPRVISPESDRSEVLVVDSRRWAADETLDVVPGDRIPEEFRSLVHVPVRSPTNAWSLARIDFPETARIVLVETVLDIGPRSVDGTTRSVVRGSRPTLELLVPASSRIDSVTVDGMAVPVTEIDDANDEGRVAVSIPTNSSATRTLVRIDWQDTRASPWPFIRSRVDLPAFRGIEVDRVLARVSNPGDRAMRLGSAAQRLEPADFVLERIDGLLATSVRGEATPEWFGDLVDKRLEEAAEVVERENTDDELTELRTERLEEAAERLESLRTLGGTIPSDWDDAERLGVPMRIPSQARSIAIGLVPDWWSVSRLLGAVLLVGLVVLGWLLGRRGVRPVAPPVPAAVALLGLVWWTCLRLGGLGLLLLAVGVWLFFRSRAESDYDRSELVV